MSSSDTTREAAMLLLADWFKTTPEHLTAKVQLLKEYAGEPVTRFREYACYIPQPPDDPDGSFVFSGSREELRSTDDIVRVTVAPDITRDDVVAALRKIIDFIARGWYDEDDA